MATNGVDWLTAGHTNACGQWKQQTHDAIDANAPASCEQICTGVYSAIASSSMERLNYLDGNIVQGNHQAVDRLLSELCFSIDI